MAGEGKRRSFWPKEQLLRTLRTSEISSSLARSACGLKREQTFFRRTCCPTPVLLSCCHTILLAAVVSKSHYTYYHSSQEHEVQALSAALSAKESLVSELETRAEMLQSAAGPGATEELVAACESDKVAASRAMKQNAELKGQLEELQMAIIKLVRKIFRDRISKKQR